MCWPPPCTLFSPPKRGGQAVQHQPSSNHCCPPCVCPCQIFDMPEATYPLRNRGTMVSFLDGDGWEFEVGAAEAHGWHARGGGGERAPGAGGCSAQQGAQQAWHSFSRQMRLLLLRVGGCAWNAHACGLVQHPAPCKEWLPRGQLLCQLSAGRHPPPPPLGPVPPAERPAHPSDPAGAAIDARMMLQNIADAAAPPPLPAGAGRACGARARAAALPLQRAHQHHAGRGHECGGRAGADGGRGAALPGAGQAAVGRWAGGLPRTGRWVAGPVFECVLWGGVEVGLGGLRRGTAAGRL